jgi:uncharacterized protein
VQITRRQFVASAALGLSCAGAAFLLRDEPRHGVLLSAFEDARGDQYVGGLSLDTSHVFGARVPVRAHGCAVHPQDKERAVFFARRPGTQAFELDRGTMRVREAFVAPAGRRLAGHGLFSPRGDLLYTPEHDYENVRGVLAVRDARTYAIVGEFDTGGIDPHEVVWSADGEQLIVANGGVLTHPKTYRRKLNIPTMDPSLSVIDAASGVIRDQQRLEDHLLSIRHLAVTTNGAVVAGLQYEGEKSQAPGVIAVYEPGPGLQLLASPNEAKRLLAGYVASIAVSDEQNRIVAACPYGRGLACFSLRERTFLGVADAREAYGVARLGDGSLWVSQRDGGVFELAPSSLHADFLRLEAARALRWDDHWVSV